jgi:hypothetical protein
VSSGRIAAHGTESIHVLKKDRYRMNEISSFFFKKSSTSTMRGT